MFSKPWRLLPALSLALSLGGCGGLPRPFEGYPGATALRLSRPPPARLAVVPPIDAMLPDQPAALLASVLTAALVAREVPAVFLPAQQGDWQLITQTRQDGDLVVPIFTIFDPVGGQAGMAQGQPVAPADWAEASETLLRRVATSAAPDIAGLLTRIEAARRASDPASLTNRPASIRIVKVKGAPGDGNVQLTRRLREQMAVLGLPAQEGEDEAASAAPVDFTIAGEVMAVPIAGKMTRIEIQWVVSDMAGEERGRIVQLNEVPAGSLDRFWGDVALVVAQEAAGGAKDVITRQR